MQGSKLQLATGHFPCISWEWPRESAYAWPLRPASLIALSIPGSYERIMHVSRKLQKWPLKLGSVWPLGPDMFIEPCNVGT